MRNPLANQAQETTIGDYGYRVEPLSFPDGRKAFVRLSNLIGPALESLASAARASEGKDETDEDAWWSAIGGALGGLLRTLKDEDLIYFETLYAKKTWVKHPPDDDGLVKEPLLAKILNDHFAGHLDEYFSWLVFCIKSTFGSFFADAWRKATALSAKEKTAAPSSSIFRTASHGKTGD